MAPTVPGITSQSLDLEGHRLTGMDQDLGARAQCLTKAEAKGLNTMVEKVIDIIIAVLNVLYLITHRYTCKYFQLFFIFIQNYLYI